MATSGRTAFIGRRTIGRPEDARSAAAIWSSGLSNTQTVHPTDGSVEVNSPALALFLPRAARYAGTMDTLPQKYDRLVAEGALRHDAAQVALLPEFERIRAALAEPVKTEWAAEIGATSILEAINAIK